MAGVPFARIETPRLVLRHFAERDLAAFTAYRNDPEIARFQSWSGIADAEARAFVAEQAANQPGIPGCWFQFAIARREGDALIGDCALRLDEAQPRIAEIGYTLSRASQGCGYAGEALGAMLDWAFATLALRRVRALTDTRNAPSIALLERLGFQREAHLRQDAWHKGEWCDEYLYAVLSDEWRARREGRPRG